MGRRCQPDLEAAWLPSLRKGQDDWQTLSPAASPSTTSAAGRSIGAAGTNRGRGAGCCCPIIRFERARHWITLDPSRRRTCGGDAALPHDRRVERQPVARHAALHGLDERTVRVIAQRAIARVSWSITRCKARRSRPPRPTSSKAWQPRKSCSAPAGMALANLVIQQAMFLPEGARRRVQFSIAPESGGEATFETYSRPADAEEAKSPWIMHANGSLVHESRATSRPRERIDLDAVREKRCGDHARTRRSMNSWPTAAWSMARPSTCSHDLHRCPEEAVDRSAAAGVGRPRGAALPAPSGARRRDAAVDVGRRAARRRTARSARSLTCRSASAAFGSCDRSTTIRNRCLRTRFARRATRPPARNESRPTCTWSMPMATCSWRWTASQVQRLGRSGGGDAAVDTSRWLYRIAWQPSDAATEKPRPAAAATTGTWLIFSDSQGVGAAAGRSAWPNGGQPCVLV